MKAIALFAITALSLGIPIPQQNQENFGLPELHKIKTISFGPSYGCQKHARPDYGDAALFLSALSRRRNTPELVFVGACGGVDSLRAMTAGDDVGVIADLGEVPLEKVTARLVFNTRDRNDDSFDFYSKFVQQAKVQPNHTYAVLIDRSEMRSIFVFTITSYILNKELDLKYAIKEYQVLGLRAQSPGFDWKAESKLDLDNNGPR
jgi:hypothetical protein